MGNLCVHTVMYFYYFIMAAKFKFLKPRSWKMLVTLMQINQFVLGILACYWASYANRWYGRCVGTVRSGLIGLFILLSYLYLFVDFFTDAYKKKDHRLPNIFLSFVALFISLFIHLCTLTFDPDHFINFYR